MGFFRTTGRVLKPLVNVPAWMGLRQISETGQVIGQITRNIFTMPEKNGYVESFEEAVNRMGLTETDIERKTKVFLIGSLMYASAAVAMLVYSFYLIKSGHLGGAWMCFCLTALLGSLTFRESFSFFQIKSRRLGCSFFDWYKGIGQLIWRWCIK